MDDRHLQRALLLFEQANYTAAEQELRQLLLSDPENPVAHAVLGLCLAKREDYDAATAEARMAIQYAPDLGLTHYAHASVLRDRNRFSEGLEAVRVAIEIDPANPGYYALQADILLALKHWEAALAAANEGLAIDPEDTGCGTTRAAALIQLGRSDEADETIEGMLEKSPNDAAAHTNQGWSLLHQGEHRKAAEHFREALRLSPDSEWARAGMLESLKARNPFYRIMLKFFLAMSKLSESAQWAIILGMWVGFQVLRRVGRSYPEWAPYVAPLLVAYVVFVIATWVATPLSNLLLRIDRFGRFVLSKDEVQESNIFGALLLACLGSCIGWFTIGEPFGLAAIWTGLMLLPVSAVYRCDAGWPRRTMTLYTLVVGGCGLAAFTFIPQLAVIFGLGCFLSSFAGNFLAMRTPRK